MKKKQFNSLLSTKRVKYESFVLIGLYIFSALTPLIFKTDGVAVIIFNSLLCLFVYWLYRSILDNSSHKFLGGFCLLLVILFLPRLLFDVSTGVSTSQTFIAFLTLVFYLDIGIFLIKKRV